VPSSLPGLLPKGFPGSDGPAPPSGSDDTRTSERAVR
jgi:hypothetical protein